MRRRRSGGKGRSCRVGGCSSRIAPSVARSPEGGAGAGAGAGAVFAPCHTPQKKQADLYLNMQLYFETLTTSF